MAPVDTTKLHQLRGVVKELVRKDRIAEDIAERIRELREHLGETQEVFAERFARGWKQISSWERGNQKPPAKVLERTARVYDWPTEIFEIDGPRPAERVVPGAGPRQRGTMVVGEGGRRYEVPGGLPVREVIDKLDLSTLPPEDVKEFAAFEVGDLELRGKAMEPKRILWWVEQAFAAGQREASASRSGSTQRGAGGAGRPGSA